MFSRDVTVVCVQPCAFATSAFLSVLLVPFNVTPSARPLAGNQSHTADGRVVQDDLAAVERIDLAKQALRRHALQDQRGCGPVSHAIGQQDQHVGRPHVSAREFDNPDALIPSHTVRELLEVSARDTGVEDFALRLAARRTLSNLGPISLVLKEEPTPRQALDTLCRYEKLLSATLITRIEDAGQVVVIREELLPRAGLGTRQAMELAVGVKMRILRELIGPQWRPRQVCFTHRPPADMASYRTFFGRNPMFNQPFNGLVCAAADLSMPRTRDDPGAAYFARDYLETALRRRGESVRDACREVILALLPGGRCTAQLVARHLRIDRRTLHRHLSEEGLTFSAMLNQLRLELAMRHLLESDMPVGEVAVLPGFSAHSSFSHWFRAAVGCSVSDWRKQSDGQNAPAE